MNKNKYSTESLGARQIYKASLLGWWPAIKRTFFPFLIAIICNLLLALASHSVKTLFELYALKILAFLIICYCLMLGFYLIHVYWQGDQTDWRNQVSVYSKRFFPAFLSIIVILLGAGFLIAVGEVMSRMILPYAHLLGKVAAPILISVVGLLAVIWVIVCFYWPFFMIRDGERFAFAVRRSFSIAAFTKTVMVFLPPCAFFLVFLFANPKLPWVNFPHSMWGDLAMEYLIKWILGAWVLVMTCLIMNESIFILEKVAADIQENKRKKKEKKVKKEAKKNANKS